MEASTLALSWRGMFRNASYKIDVLIMLLLLLRRGAVALDGRIEPGDMILQVNDINFENMSNDDAVRVLREVVQKPG